jgi:drug/metabolite transporter (DMT)-like permease
MNARTRAYLYLLATVLIWGAASPVIKLTLSAIDPLPFLSYRFLISGILAAAIIFLRRISLPKSMKLKFLLLAYGLTGTTFALGFLFIGLDNTTVLDLALIGAIGPLLIAVGGAVFLKEKISRQETLGISIALIGVFIVTIYPIITQTDGISLSGNIFILAYLIFDASSVLIARELVRKKVSPGTVSNYAFIVAAITIIPFTLLSYSPHALVKTIMDLSLSYHLGVWYMAVLSGIVAYWFFAKGEKVIEAGEAGLFFYLHPVFSAPLAVVWLGEQITPRFIVGAAIIGTGVAIAEHKRTKKEKRY